ncbi:MAG: 30S ribosomal protein S6 [Patescibacteria group bacterium]|jgi:ribosomal protein S6
MNKYEITFITKEDLKEEPVKKEIEALDGKISEVNGLGQKQLAFSIKKETAGYYTAVKFTMAPEKVMELNKKLSLKGEILRHLIIIVKAAQIEAPKPAKVETKAITEPKPEEIMIPEEKAMIEPAVSALAKPAETEIKAVTKEKEAPKIQETPEPSKEKPKKETVKKPSKPKIEKPVAEPKEESLDVARDKEVSTEERLKALDKKLDELLKE